MAKSSDKQTPRGPARESSPSFGAPVAGAIDPHVEVKPVPSHSGAGRLVVIANRLPVARQRQKGKKSEWTISPGGLVSALTPILQESRGAWVGWHGSSGAAPDPFDNEGIRLRPVGLSRSEFSAFYEGFSNRTLWPLYHDALRTPEFRRRWWWPYRDVNRRFAEAAAEELRPGDVAWVQDYHLQLVPSMLRELRPDVRIGFFLHIPFPALELYSRLPWRREIVEGLLGADLIGFQTRLGVKNFFEAARRFGGYRLRDGKVQVGGREASVRALPISIDAAEFASIAQTDRVRRRAAQLKERIEARKLILGVDRLDYTKGIDVRLRAVEEVLSRGNFGVEDFCAIQVAVPSRETVTEYAEQRSRIEELVGRINGEFSETGATAVQYLRRSLPREELVAYYLAADVMAVTPLRDGMNLVAKEYVASRVDGDGVLVLSEFAGAASELRQAMLVNPFDIDGMASTLEAALGMEERAMRRQMATLRRAVARHDVHDWAEQFFGALVA